MNDKRGKERIGIYYKKGNNREKRAKKRITFEMFRIKVIQILETENREKGRGCVGKKNEKE